ncbi:MAG: DUF359 domain-containing protein [Euryarchaeota archaeon]|nr:DUF359 domain-containing protein [Euryarchaeota archaeon]
MPKSILDKNFCLPDTMRSEMRRQFGILYPGDGKKTIKNILHDIGSPANIITIGDISTFNVLQCSTIPDISIIDEKTHRKPADSNIIKGIRHFTFKMMYVNNPSGCVTSELVQAISQAISINEPVQIMVNGEEDLAALPAIVLAPVSSVVIYGLPDEGAIVVTVTHDIKDMICDMMERMKCE